MWIQCLISLFCVAMATIAPPPLTAQNITSASSDIVNLSANDVADHRGVSLHTAFWRYSAGDSLAWASSTYDDALWMRGHTNFQLDSLPRQQWQGISWFRLRLHIDTTLSATQLVLAFRHWGASEIYCDGHLLQRFGTVSVTPDCEQSHQPNGSPVVLLLDAGTVHTLAIRYSHTQAVQIQERYGSRRAGIAGFECVCYAADSYVSNSLDERTATMTIAMIPLGILILLMVLHGLLFFFYRDDRSNLYFSVLAAVLAWNSFSLLLPTYSHAPQELIIWNSIIFAVSSTFAGLFLMMSVYSVLYAQLPKRFYILILPVIAVSFINAVWNPPFKQFLSLGVVLIVLLETVRTSVLTIRRGRQGAYILCAGALLFLLTSIAYWFVTLANIPLTTTARAWFMMGDLTMPLAMSIITAKRFAQINRHLTAQLDQVQELSAESLRQARERQIMIATQNEHLEHEVVERTYELRLKNIELVEANIEIQRQIEVQGEQARDIQLANTELQEKHVQIEAAMRQLQTMQTQLVQAEKMAGLGQLTAGVAHEINNPLNFISGALTPLKLHLESIFTLLQKHGALTTETSIEQHLAEIATFRHDIEFDEILPETKALIASMENGTQRILEIVRGLRVFSRLDEDDLKFADLQEGIDATLVILRNQYKDYITITKYYGRVPLIECYPGQLNQVFMNILANGIQALDEMHRTDAEILITTFVQGTSVIVSIKDNGPGMNDDVKSHIFEPFFTTKDVGKGTGLGLSIAFGIVEKHHGTIEVVSQLGVGTEFFITLPLYQSRS